MSGSTPKLNRMKTYILGNVCQIMTRHLHLPIIDSTCWDGYVVLDQKYIDELKFWFSNCDTLPFRVISPIVGCPVLKKTLSYRVWVNGITHG